MKSIILSILVTGIMLLNAMELPAKEVRQGEIPNLNTADMQITGSSVTYIKELELVVFEITVNGAAGRTVPVKKGQLDGAPVLGYVFPTTLKPSDVGFKDVDGILALAVTSHPDFDDTPLWDENNDANNDNDGIIFHSHWVVLIPDNRVTGGLSVKALDPDQSGIRLPATHPGMPIYLDSPGFAIILKNNTLKVLVPTQRIRHNTDFTFDAVTAYMQVSKDKDMPMLGVYQVYQVQSGDLSLPFKVEAE